MELYDTDSMIFISDSKINVILSSVVNSSVRHVEWLTRCRSRCPRSSATARSCTCRGWFDSHRLAGFQHRAAHRTGTWGSNLAHFCTTTRTNSRHRHAPIGRRCWTDGNSRGRSNIHLGNTPCPAVVPIETCMPTGTLRIIMQLGRIWFLRCDIRGHLHRVEVGGSTRMVVLRVTQYHQTVVFDCATVAEYSYRSTVCPSNQWKNPLHILWTPYERSIHLVFRYYQ